MDSLVSIYIGSGISLVTRDKINNERFVVTGSESTAFGYQWLAPYSIGLDTTSTRVTLLKLLPVIMTIVESYNIGDCLRVVASQ